MAEEVYLDIYFFKYWIIQQGNMPGYQFPSPDSAFSMWLWDIFFTCLQAVMSHALVNMEKITYILCSYIMLDVCYKNKNCLDYKTIEFQYIRNIIIILSHILSTVKAFPDIFDFCLCCSIIFLHSQQNFAFHNFPSFLV